MAEVRFVDPSQPGYTRRRRGKGWEYLKPDGRRLTHPATIARLNAVALPPAYTNAWYARDPHAHLQATGVDAAGRTQYRYHPEFRRLKEEEKFARTAEFGTRLPRIRAAVVRDLGLRVLSKRRVVAAVVRLLDLGRVRVGNTAYARQNGSFGATTLRNRHAAVSGKRIKLDYLGKSGIRHTIGLEDARLATVVRRCQDEPGHLLFQYRDAEGGLHPVTSGDVNEWLRDNGGEGFTAKDFRTWSASVLAFEFLTRSPGPARIKPLLEHVAARLGNTPAVARRSYIHPALIAAAGTATLSARKMPRRSKWLSRTERGLVEFLAEADAAGFEG